MRSKPTSSHFIPPTSPHTVLSLSHLFITVLSVSPLLHIYHQNHLLKFGNQITKDINSKYFISGDFFIVYLFGKNGIYSISKISTRFKIKNGLK